MKRQKKPTDEIPTKGFGDNSVENLPFFKKAKKASWAEMFQDYWQERFSRHKEELNNFPVMNLVTDVDALKSLSEFQDSHEDNDTVNPEILKEKKIFEEKDHLSTHSPEDYTDIPSYESQIFIEGAQIGSFSIGKKIGEGGMGAIFPISKNGKEYIIKIPLREGVQKTSLENEIDVLNYVWKKVEEKKAQNPNFQEPNIVKIHAFSKGLKTYAILEPLEDLIQSKKTPKKLSSERIHAAGGNKHQGQQPVRVARYIYDMAKSLEFLHSINVIHGDVKYHNCMDTHKNKRLEMILFDFGLAKILTEENEPNIRKCEKLGMTVHYVTKNLINEWIKYTKIFKECPLSKLRAVLKKADWEALALSAYHLLTGISPYSLYDSSNKKYECPLNYNPDPISYIFKAEQDPIDYNILKSMQPYGQVFAKVFQTLRDPAIILPETVKKVYSTLKRGIHQPGLFD